MPPRSTRRAQASPAAKRSPSPSPPPAKKTPSKRASAKSPARAAPAPIEKTPEPPASKQTKVAAAAKPRAVQSGTEPRGLQVLKAILFIPWILCACGCIGVVVYAKAVHSPPHSVGDVLRTIIDNGGGVSMTGSGTARIAVGVDGTTSNYDPKRCDNRLCEDDARLVK